MEESTVRDAVLAFFAAAGVNKRMLYHYFGNKRDLYREVYERQVIAHGARVEGNPIDPIDALPYWYDEISRDVEWTRLLGWEALTEESHGSVGAAALRRNYDGAVGWVKDAQARGLISAELDPELYLLMTIAVNMFPLGFPQVTRSVTGWTHGTRRSASANGDSWSSRQAPAAAPLTLTWPPAGRDLPEASLRSPLDACRSGR